MGLPGYRADALVREGADTAFEAVCAGRPCVQGQYRSSYRKRSLALREFALGMESLTRFVSKEPLYRVHECVFGVLAFESEPVDPRL